MATLSEEFVFEYFSQLNPIAYKIQAEINQTIENYEHYWNDLDKREQMTIINEAVIKPEIQMNYHKKAGVNTPYPYRDVDKNVLNYFVPKGTAPHPFSFKTKSQLNLFYSFTPEAEEPVDDDSVVIKVPPKPKTHQTNKSTDSLTCVNLVNLNVKPKKGRAPAIPTKMTTKPPPPPPPTTKAAAPPTPPVASPVIEEIPKIPEDADSNTSLISPREEAEVVPKVAGPTAVDSAHETDDEFKSLLSSNEIDLDFLKNW